MKTLQNKKKKQKENMKIFLKKYFVLTNIKLKHKEILKSGDIYVGKHKFHILKKNKNDWHKWSCYWSHICYYQKSSVNEKCFKYFTGYGSHFEEEITPLFINLPKLKGPIKTSEKVKYMWLVLKEKPKIILKSIT